MVFHMGRDRAEWDGMGHARTTCHMAEPLEGHAAFLALALSRLPSLHSTVSDFKVKIDPDLESEAR